MCIRDNIKAGTTPVTHFTVIKNTKEGIKQQLEQYLAEGVDHMLALRGDIPLGETTTCGDFDYATDLVAFTRKEFGDKFEIAVAGSPAVSYTHLFRKYSWSETDQIHSL